MAELKTTAFKPEYVGKVNFYLAALDDTLKQADDNPSIGMILCKNKKQLTIEYALRNFTSPIGVSSYATKITDVFTKNLKNTLPTVEQFEQELSKKLECEEPAEEETLTNTITTKARLIKQQLQS